MTRLLGFLLVALVWLRSFSVHADDPPHVRRFAVLVGANDGGDKRDLLRHAEADAHAVARVLRDIGGVAPDDSIIVAQPTAKALRERLTQVANEVRKSSRGRTTTHFVFYYSGHSDETGLMLGSERLSYRELRELINQIPADVRLGVLDSCSSGAFTRSKGGRHRPPFLVGSPEVQGHAFLTSSAADEAAQESDRIGGSFFTHHLITGLRGAADKNADRLITLGEAYQFAFDETLATTERSQRGVQHAAYEIELVGSGDLIMTDLRRTTAILDIEADVSGHIIVRDGSGHLASELNKPQGSGPIVLALEPGTYSITVQGEESLARARVELVDGKTALLSSAILKPFAGEVAMVRGGASEDSEYRRIPVSFGLFPPAQVNFIERQRKVVNNFAFNVFLGRVDRIRGVELATGVNWVKEDVQGAQLALNGNLAFGGLRGLQWTSGFNYASTKRASDPSVDMVGAQLSAMINVADGNFRGAQLASVGNVTTGTRRGFAASTLFGYAGELQGGQLALINVTGSGRGAQVGLINIATGKIGTQVGLINVAREANVSVGMLGISRKHPIGGDVWTDDISLLNAGLRLRARWTYTMVSAGLQPFPLRMGGNWNVGLVLGGQFDVSKRIYLAFDLGTRGVFPGLRASRPLLLSTTRFLVGVRLHPKVSLYMGPSFNLLIGDRDRYRDFRPGYGWSGHAERVGNVTFRMWPGFALGLQF